jgi:hypothetical protein
MSNAMKLFFGLSVSCLCGAPNMFGSSLFFLCSPINSFSTGEGDGTDTCPAASGLPIGATITAVKSYDIADFQNGVAGVRDSVHVVFLPSDAITIWGPVFSVSSACNVENAHGGTSSATNSCNFYSGTLTAPGTLFQSANGHLDALAAAGFTVQVSSSNLFGSVGTSFGGNIVEYEYTVSAPEPATGSQVGLFLIVLSVLGRRRLARRSDPKTLAR